MGFKYSGLEIEAAGKVVPSWEAGPEGPGLQSIACTVRLKTSESPERLKALEGELEKRCPVGNTLRRAGVKMAVSWEVSQ